MKGSYPLIHVTFLSRCPPRSRDKLKALYLHYLSVYGNQTWKNGDLPWRTSNYKVWLGGLAKSRHKLKLLYLCNHSVYDHQTWQVADLTWGTLT